MTDLENCLGTLVKDFLVEVWVVHGQTATGKEIEDSLVLLVVE